MKIEGERILIRRTEKEDLNDIMALWNNGEVMKWVGFPDGLNISMERVKDWYEKISCSKKAHHFIIITKDNYFCGELFYLKDIEHKRSGLDIKLIDTLQGKGYATEALELLVDHIFRTEIDVEAVWTEPSSVNIAARNLYSRCGLKAKERPSDMEEAESYWELSRQEWEENNLGQSKNF